jgi:Tfp pilus assembly protein PilW
MKQFRIGGFTLVEITLYISASAILVFLISSFLSEVVRARLKHETISEVEQQGAAAVTLITQAIRGAGSITTVTPTSLSLSMPQAPISPTVITASANSLTLTEGTSPSIPLTSSRISVSNVLFQDVSQPNTPGTIRLQFTLSAVNPGNQAEYTYARTFTATASLRHP